MKIAHGACARTSGALIAWVLTFSTVAARAVGQQSEAGFEVASIKENRSGAAGTSMTVLPGSRLVATNISLETLITAAYGTDTPLPPSRVVMPAGWTGAGAPRFDLDAKPGRALTQTEFLPAVRRLLEERFKLAIHREMRELPSYALVMDRGDRRLGPRLKRSDVDCTDPVEIKARDDNGALKCGIRGRAGSALGRQPVAALARFLTNLVPDQRMVTDQTNLVGTYEFQIDWAPEVPTSPGGAATPADSNATSIFTAVREQLGLKLESVRQLVDVLVVERAERPTED
jgi:uncharacterized protein (TIGR03435 family)